MSSHHVELHSLVRPRKPETPCKQGPLDDAGRSVCHECQEATQIARGRCLGFALVSPRKAVTAVCKRGRQVASLLRLDIKAMAAGNRRKVSSKQEGQSAALGMQIRRNGPQPRTAAAGMDGSRRKSSRLCRPASHTVATPRPTTCIVLRRANHERRVTSVSAATCSPSAQRGPTDSMESAS